MFSLKNDGILLSDKRVSLFPPGLEFTQRGENSTAVKPERLLSILRLTVHLSTNLLLSLSLAVMLCWGSAVDGQLGIGEQGRAVYEPRNCQVFCGRGLKEVACGGQHSLFLLHDGSVYTCGSNSCGQLGHDKPGASPGELLV